MLGKVDLKELAAGFGMKVNELAGFLGYTRQALYQMNDGTNGICTGRYFVALEQLKRQSDMMYEADLERALEAKQTREHMIWQMGENVGGVNVVKRNFPKVKEFRKHKCIGV